MYAVMEPIERRPGTRQYLSATNFQLPHAPAGVVSLGHMSLDLVSRV